MRSRLQTLLWLNCLDLKDTLAHEMNTRRDERQETNLDFEMPVFLAVRIEFIPTGRKDTIQRVTVHSLKTRNAS
jgi:hypothetical protein